MASADFDAARRRRPSTRAARIGLLLLCGWLAIGLHAAWCQHHDGVRLARARALVRSLDLTDMAWFNEARYTRHLGLADLHSAFQDGPGAPEHFPSGTLAPPPHRFAAAGASAAPAASR